MKHKAGSIKFCMVSLQSVIDVLVNFGFKKKFLEFLVGEKGRKEDD